jgi:hypothetical protein
MTFAITGPNDFSPPTARTGMVRYQPFKAVRLRAGQIHQDRKIQEWISPVIGNAMYERIVQ